MQYNIAIIISLFTIGQNTSNTAFCCMLCVFEGGDAAGVLVGGLNTCPP